MEFSIHANTIKKLISNVSGGLSKSKDSILGNYLVAIKNNTISIISSNETMQMYTSAPIDSDAECSFLAKPDLFNRLKFLNGDINFKLEKQLLKIKSGYYETTAKVFDTQDYLIESVDGSQTVCSFKASDLLELIKVHIATSEKEEMTHEFSGVLININEKTANFVASNRLRLFWISKPIDDDINFYCISEKDSILQLGHMLKADDTVNLLYKSEGDNIIKIIFQGSDWTIISKTINGKFPEYQAITMNESQGVQCISFDKESLKDSLQKVMVLSDDKSSAIKLDIKDSNMEIGATNGEGEMAMDIVDFTSCNHTPIAITMNGRYSADFLNAVQSNELKLYYKETTKPIELKAVSENNINYVYIMTLVK